MVVRTLGVGIAAVQFCLARMEEKKKITLLKKIAGITLIVVGIIALITPFTPGSWLVFIGLEILGLRLFLQNKFPKISRIFRIFRGGTS